MTDLRLIRPFPDKGLPPVQHVFSEPEEVIDLKLGSIIQDNFSGEGPEDLVLNRLYKHDFRMGLSIEDRIEIHFKSSIAAGKLPGGQVIVGIDMKSHLFQLVGFMVIKQHILAGRGTIAESITDIPTEGMTIEQTRGRSPIPPVFIGPVSSSPVQYPET